MGQVKIASNVYCQQGGEDQVDLVFVNTPLASIKANRMLSDGELQTLGTEIFDAMSRIPSMKEMFCSIEKQLFLDDVIMAGASLERWLRPGEVVEVLVNERSNMIGVGTYHKKTKIYSHEKDVTSVENVDLNKLREVVRNHGWKISSTVDM